MTAATITTSVTQPSNDTTPSSIEKYRVSIQLIGIKKRCRKSERHFFHFSHLPYNNGTYDHDTLKSEVISWIHTNMKEVFSKVRVNLDYVVIENERGFTVTKWEPFCPNHFSFEFNL